MYGEKRRASSVQMYFKDTPILRFMCSIGEDYIIARGSVKPSHNQLKDPNPLHGPTSSHQVLRLCQSTDTSSDNQNTLEIPKYFKNNDLKAQLQAKDTTICKLKEHIESMRENDKEEKVKQELDEIETINIELEHSVAKLLYENERLHKKIEHLKKIYKDHFDLIKKTRGLSKEHCDSLIAQLNYRSMENADLKRSNSRKGMFKLDLDPLAPRLLKNWDTHIDYLKYNQEQADILLGIVKQAKAKQPLDNA
ncbi:hypothetical protein Tco_1357351 [Tanacetum coccineum]